MSPLTQGRGSKRDIAWSFEATTTVAPHTGAWIETVEVGRISCGVTRRPSHRGVDRNMYVSTIHPTGSSRPSHRGVDRNKISTVLSEASARRPSHRGVDRNVKLATLKRINGCRPSHRGVDRNISTLSGRCGCVVAPHTGAWIETICCCCCICCARRSPLTQGRGSKQTRVIVRETCLKVAPHTGAWIETWDNVNG